MNRGTAAIAISVALAACGGGATAPAAISGTWGADCSEPFVTFARGSVHVYPDKADYRLKSAVMTGGDLAIAYDGTEGPVEEHYILAGDTLRLDRGTYAGTQAIWHKAPMRRCS